VPQPSPSPAPQPSPSEPAPVAEKHHVILNWHPSASAVMGYNIYRGTQHGGPYSKINSELEPATVYTDDAVSSGATYYYVVTAVDASSESVHSNEMSAVIPDP